MRLPRTKVFRAFPELDRFSDEHCRQIVRRARRANPATAIGCWISASLAFVVVGVGTAAVTWLVVGAVLSGGRTEPLIVALVLGSGVAVVIGLASAAALFARDVSTRELLRLHLGGARCPGCGYPLAGLGVHEGQVRCPECGVAVESIGGAERSASTSEPGSATGSVPESATGL